MRFSLLLAVVICTPGFCPVVFAQIHPGGAIFQRNCAECHGPDGQGSPAGYDQPLSGDQSIDDLARLIDGTMPADEPEKCRGEDARQVADYIFHAFYSVKARENGRWIDKPRVQLSRLTVPQYRNSIADLILHFTPTPRRDKNANQHVPENKRNRGAETEPRGLLGKYFQSKGMNKAEKLSMQRVDSRIDFDFGEGSPSDDISDDQFLIVWNGAVEATHTGIYEFQLSTQNGARLFLNRDPEKLRGKLRDDSSASLQTALIDGWVSSGEMRHHRARIFLLGGRQYSLKLEFFKYKEQSSSIKLQWKPPHGVWSVVDDQHLINRIVPRTFVVHSDFDADDHSLGYDRGSSVSKQWYSATSRSAVAVADEVVSRLPILTGFDYRQTNNQDLLKKWLLDFAETAFRRPLTSPEAESFGERFLDDFTNLDAAVRRFLVFVLQSPDFLYADVAALHDNPDQYTVASRMARAMWDSIPDRQLHEAARQGQLQTPQQVRFQSQRMLNDPRSRLKMRGFFEHWLELDERDLSKDTQLFPEFDESVIADLRRSLELFIEQVVWSEASDYRQLLLADYLVLNQRLREIYSPPTQLPVPEAENPGSGPTSIANKDVDGFENVTLATERRAGIITHPYLLSSLAYSNNSSPIHRGVFLTRKIAGRALNPPPQAVAFENEDFPADLTLREKITQLTSSTACMSCHHVINPLGFALENYDAVGRFRNQEDHKQIDTQSVYTTVAGQTLSIADARDIAQFSVASSSAHESFVTHLFHHLVKQNPRAYGPDTIENLRRRFVKDNFNVQNLVVEIVTVAALDGVTISGPPSSNP